MNASLFRIAAAIAAVLPVVAQADNVTGSKHLICASALVTQCYARGECETGPPWKWNMLQFVQLDLDKKTISSMPAAAQQKRSPITTLVREQGQILVQGTENGRAFSMVIVEETGQASLAVALDGITASAFGACTPSP